MLNNLKLRGIHRIGCLEYRERYVLPEVKTESIRNGQLEIDCKETHQLILQKIPDISSRQIQSLALIRNCEYDMAVWTLEGQTSISILAQANSFIALEQNTQGKQKRVISYRENPEYQGRNSGGFEVITTESEPIKVLTSAIGIFEGNGLMINRFEIEPHLEIWMRIVLSDESAVVLRAERSVSSLIVRAESKQTEWDFKFIRKDLAGANRAQRQIEMNYGQLREAS